MLEPESCSKTVVVTTLTTKLVTVVAQVGKELNEVSVTVCVTDTALDRQHDPVYVVMLYGAQL